MGDLTIPGTQTVNRAIMSAMMYWSGGVQFSRVTASRKKLLSCWLNGWKVCSCHTALSTWPVDFPKLFIGLYNKITDSKTPKGSSHPELVWGANARDVLDLIRPEGSATLDLTAAACCWGYFIILICVHLCTCISLQEMPLWWVWQ